MGFSYVRSHVRLVAGALILGGLVLVAVIGPALAPHDPNQTTINKALAPPDLAAPLGSDIYGRDLLSRLLWASRYSFSLALSATALALASGSALGILAGIAPRQVDLALAFLIDLLLSLPGFLTSMVIVAALNPEIIILTIAIAIAQTPRIALIVRASTLQACAAPHIEAARALGIPFMGILWRAILPAVLPVIIVLAGTVFGNVVIAEAGLSFLGIGIRPPDPSWGSLIADAGSTLQSHPWLSLPPVCCIALTVAGANLVGDGLHDWLDPHRRTWARA
jgi:peptide/nickel transport system permease protein